MKNREPEKPQPQPDFRSSQEAALIQPVASGDSVAEDSKDPSGRKTSLTLRFCFSRYRAPVSLMERSIFQARIGYAASSLE
jgi:hypothetical protein